MSKKKTDKTAQALMMDIGIQTRLKNLVLVKKILKKEVNADAEIPLGMLKKVLPDVKKESK